MANTASNVSTGKPKTTGAIFMGASTATLPTTASATITGFTCLGYVSEDGVTNDASPSSDKIKAWGGDTVLVVQTEKEDTFTFTLIESMSVDVLKLVYGDDNVTGTTGASTVKVNSTAPEAHAFVIDMALTSGYLKRICIPSGTVTEIGTISYTDSDAVGYELTIECTPDSSGNTHYEYISAKA